MNNSPELIDLYLRFKEAPSFVGLEEEILLPFLQLGRVVDYPGDSVILPKGSDIRYIYTFLEGEPVAFEENLGKPVFWGLKALVAPQTNTSELVAPPEGSRVLVFPVARLIAFLNEAPDLLIALIKQTTKT